MMHPRPLVKRKSNFVGDKSVSATGQECLRHWTGVFPLLGRKNFSQRVRTTLTGVLGSARRAGPAGFADLLQLEGHHLVLVHDGDEQESLFREVIEVCGSASQLYQ